jgi:hypothetical protein
MSQEISVNATTSADTLFRSSSPILLTIYFYFLFYVTKLNCIGYISVDGKMSVNDKFERTWKELVSACYKLLSQFMTKRS